MIHIAWELRAVWKGNLLSFDMKRSLASVDQEELPPFSAVSYPGTPFYNDGHANQSEVTIGTSQGVRSSSRWNAAANEDLSIVVSETSQCTL